MLYCEKCGKIYEDHIKICPDCKCNLAIIQNSTLNSNISYTTYKKVPLGTLIFGALFPWLGLLLYIMYRDTQPENAKRVKSALLIYLFMMLLLTIIMAKAIWR